jgi:uncharacterized protein (DUF1778 family)
MAASAKATSKEERVNIRMNGSAKRKLEKAAAYDHKSLSDFMVVQALKSADRVIRKNESITLSQQNWEVFRAALANPPKPNKKLKEAFRQHRRLVGQT